MSTRRVNLVALAADLEALAAELLETGTPFTIRKDVKTLIRKLPVIEAARERNPS